MENQEQPGVPAHRTIEILLWLIVLASGIATVGGRVVGGWVGMFAAAFAGFITLGTASGLVGFPCITSWLMIGLATGISQSVYWGWTHHGWIGALVGLPVGFGLGFVGSVVPVMLLGLLAVCFDRSTTEEEPVAAGPESDLQPETKDE